MEALAATWLHYRPPPLHRPRASPFLLALLSYQAAVVAANESARKDGNGVQQQRLSRRLLSIPAAADFTIFNTPAPDFVAKAFDIVVQELIANAMPGQV